MNWFFLALVCAFATACSDAVSKRIMDENDEWITGAMTLGLASLFLAPVFLSQDYGPVSLDLLLVLAVLVPLDIFAYYVFLSAIRMSPLSLTLPLLAFTPVVTILTAAALLSEHVSLSGALGICLVTTGAYILNGDLANQGLLAPIRAIFSNRGSRRMLFVALVWALTSTLGKQGILLYGAIQFGAVLLICNAAGLALIALLRSRMGSGKAGFSRRMLALFLVGGLLMAAAHLTHVLSLSLAPVAYMISVKRLSLVFGVLLGWFCFSEGNIRYRLAGACVMVAGVFVIYE
jgi:drug/metabolite transporter (DMT)-like permease